MELKGSYVALILPFRDGEIDYPALDKLIEFHIKNGTDGILVCGTTGESATISHKEHIDLINHVVKTADKRIKVMAGTGSNSTSEALKLAKAASEAGADCHLSITPYYNKPTAEGQFRHFTTIADAVDLPMVLYNVPGRTGTNMSPTTIGRLASHPHIVGVKEASGSVKQSIEILELTGPDFNLFSGEDALNYPIMAVGGVGAISVTANIVPARMSEMCAKMAEGDFESAKAIHYSLMPLHRAMFFETNPIPAKTSAHLMGILEHLEYRLPITPMTDEGLTRLTEVLKSQKLI